MMHRRSYSDSDVKDNNALLDNDVSDDESIASSSVHTVDLYTGWRLPEVSLSIKLPGWFVVLVTLLLFKGPASCDA
jgi:hypothetical protein